jgi:hypothetical protein
MNDMLNLKMLSMEAAELLRSGKENEEVFRCLRSKGCSKTQSVLIFASASGCDMRESKRQIHFSKTWADTKESDETFQEQIDRALDESQEDRQQNE